MCIRDRNTPVPLYVEPPPTRTPTEPVAVLSVILLVFVKFKPPSAKIPTSLFAPANIKLAP